MKNKPLCLIALGLSFAAPLAAQDLTITNAHIVVGNGTVIERGSIVVRGGRIVSVAAGAPASTSGQVIDAGGMSAMAGFIDAHRHINTGPEEKAQMQRQLEAGYTTILSGGGPGDGNLTLREPQSFGRDDARSVDETLLDVIAQRDVAVSGTASR